MGFLLGTALGIAAVGTNQTAFLELHGIMLMAIGTLHAFLFGTILNKFFQCAAHTVTPGINAFLAEIESGNDANDIVYRNTVAQQSRRHLGIIPKFLIKAAVQTAENHFITSFVQILEII